MSVTISISGGVEYAEANGLVEVLVDSCCHLADCQWCQGTNRVEFKEYPFEMNLANGNFATFRAALGCLGDGEYYEGEADGRVILQALKSFDPELSVRADRDLTGETGPKIYSFGLRSDQVSRYCETLQAIAEEAVRRESPVVWS